MPSAFFTPLLSCTKLTKTVTQMHNALNHVRVCKNVLMSVHPYISEWTVH